MKVYYLGRSQANAALACGIRFDGTDKIEDFGEFIDDVFTSGDKELILRKSNILLKMPPLNRVELEQQTNLTDSDAVVQNATSLADEFIKLFPEFVGQSHTALVTYLKSHAIAVTDCGDIVLADTCQEEIDSDLLERIFKALCDRLGVEVALSTPFWTALKSV